jgi:probable HAF family extracellular repeat protein
MIFRLLPRSTIGILAIASSLAAPTSVWAECSTSTPCAETPIDIGNLGGSSFTTINSFNVDGSEAVGQSSTIGSNSHAFRWTSGGGIQDLGTLGGSSSNATMVSSDGSVVAGSSDTSTVFGSHAFRWTSSTGMQDIDPLGSSSLSYVTGMSADGSVLSGNANSNNIFRWTSPTGMLLLNALPGDSNAFATLNNGVSNVSADGSTILGTSFGASGARAVRWFGESLTAQDLGAGVGSDAQGVSADGSVISGRDLNYTSVFRWTASGGFTNVGAPVGSISINSAFLSSDGNAIIGDVIFGNLVASYHWDQVNGFNSINPAATFSNLSTRAFSGDGSVVVGIMFGSSSAAFRWTEASGTRDLNVLLSDAGVDMNGIVLEDATAISRDGKVIGARDGNLEAYIVKYDDGTAAAGVTTGSSLQKSINQLANAHTTVLAQQHGLALPLLGDDKPITDRNEVGVFGYGGSAAGGGLAQFSSGTGLSILAGVSYGEENYDSANVSDSLMGALAIRYVKLDQSAWHPFVEVGGWLAPNAELEFDRQYTNGAGSASATGYTSGNLSYLFARAGAFWDLSYGKQFLLTGEIGRETNDVSGYEETSSNVNPFNAVAASTRDAIDIAKLRAAYSFQISGRLDATVWAAGAYGFNQDVTIATNVVDVGLFSAKNDDDVGWAEYGARIGYALNDAITLDLFANGVSGASNEVDTRVHGGAGLRYHF